MLLPLNSFFKSVHSRFTATKRAQTRRRRGTADKVSLTFRSERFLQMEPQGTKDNSVHKQHPGAKSVSCKHNLPPDRCTTVGRQTPEHTQSHSSRRPCKGSLFTTWSVAPYLSVDLKIIITSQDQAALIYSFLFDEK